MIVQNVSHKGYTDMTFTTAKADAKKAYKLMEKVAGELGAKLVAIDEDIAKISIVGSGMRSHSGIATKMFSDPIGRGHQYRDDQHVRDQDLLRHQGEIRRAGGAGPPHGLRPRRGRGRGRAVKIDFYDTTLQRRRAVGRHRLLGERQDQDHREAR